MDFSNLANTIESVDKLNDFINVSDSKDEVLEASFYLAKIYFEIKKYDEALSTITKNITDDIKKNFNEYYHKFIDLLIKIYTDTYNLNDAIKWINKKRENLGVLDIYKADILLLVVYIKGNEEMKAITLCNKLLKEQIDLEEKTFILKYLIEYYLHNNDFDNALTYIRKLKENTYELDNYNYYYALYYEAYCLFNFNELQESMKLNDECLENRMFTTEELSIKSYILDLKIHIALGEYKKASLIETEYESTIMDSNYYDKLDFFNACIDLYTKDYNKPSLEIYKERLSRLEKPTNESIDHYRINLKPIKIKEEKEVVKVDNYKDDKKTVYSIITNFLSLSNNVVEKGIKPKLRDNLLVVLDELSKYVGFEVCVIVNNNRAFDGFYYKKNRLYEKDFKDIRNTVIYDSIKHKSEQIYPTREDLKNKRDIYLDTLYEQTNIDSLISFPILKNYEVVVVIYFYAFDQSLSLGFNYELLKYASIIIGDRIINKNTLIDIKGENNSYQNAFNNADVALKYISGEEVYLNNKATELLKVKNKLKLNEFMINISSDDYKAYREYLSSDVEDFKYRFNELDLLEKKKMVGKDIISILEDNSLFANLERKENELIYLDSETRVKNMYSLKKDLNTFMQKEKFSIINLNIKTYSRIVDCYGIEYAKRLIRNTAMYLKEYFNTDYVYHFNRDEFYCIIDGINDSRTVEKKCIELIEYLRLNVNKNSSRIEAKYNVGALRYKSQTLIKDIDLLLDYVGFAMKTASQSPNSFAYFDLEEYKKAFNDTSMIANINEAIDNNKIGVSYNQVIDLKNMTTSFYRINPVIVQLNATRKEILDVVALRGLSFKLEILMIRKSISEILKVYNKEKRYIRISINVTYDTLLHPEFIPFMKRLVIDNKLPKGLVIFDLIGKMKDVSKEIEALSNMGVRFMSGNIEDCMLSTINYFRVSYILPHLKTPKGMAVLESLKQMSEPLNMKLIIAGIEKDEIGMLKEYEIDLVSYGKDLLLDDILKKMED
ncbi:MAG: EAL domain-containing protein [Acholeplasmatales bacterium]|nr:EAL domain-containing protein [Acholeplasmatales bacterium]